MASKYSDWTIKQLKEELSKRCCKNSGYEAELCLSRAVVKAPTSPLFSNLYIGLKSMNALNTNFFLLPIKLLPLEQSTACFSFALDITKFFQKTSQIIPVWTTFLFVATCIQTMLALLQQFVLPSALYNKLAVMHFLSSN